jgi:hypothetical protein
MQLHDSVQVINKLKTYPFSRLAFITIRDGTQSSKWCEISKIRSWIRRYSKDYIIVKGIVGGIHFHLLAGISRNCTLKPQKGIHFHIKYLNDKVGEIYYDTPEDVQDKLKILHYRSLRFEDLTRSVGIEQQSIISRINAMILRYWRLIKDKEKRNLAKDKKSAKITSVIDYLQKNLDENPYPDQWSEYWIS